jgi:drug/metabolite transporter (DMT)-like permease/uncharacterized protein YjiS (DUF1127 family)
MDSARLESVGETRGASRRRGEALGILAAVLSSSLGGINTAATRYVIGATDPVTLAGMRFGLGFLLLLPIALALKSRWPKGRDWPGVALLGILFFAIFMGLFNLSLEHTSAARGALALSTLPLVTMLVASALKAERLSGRKSAGVLIAIGGVGVALLADLKAAPAGAWRGDAIMVAATLCMALYSIWSRPLIARSSAMGFVAAGMGCGSLVQCLLALAGGDLGRLSAFGAGQWAAIAYLGVFGGALTFFLWVVALAHTTPTKVTNTITLNPLTASIVAALLIGEPIGLSLVVGIAAVFTGILIASTDRPAGPNALSRGSLLWRGAVSRFRSWHAEWRERQRNTVDLQLMSKAQLRDLGLVREDITGEQGRRLAEIRLEAAGQLRSKRPPLEEHRKHR